MTAVVSLTHIRVVVDHTVYRTAKTNNVKDLVLILLISSFSL